jgi:hypothetical protein
MQSASPKEAAIWIADTRSAIRSSVPFTSSTTRRSTGPSDDRRLYALAARSQRWIAKRQGRLEGGERSVVDATLAQLVATSVGASSPAWDRLTEIAKEQTAGVAKGPGNRTAGLARHQARGGSP